MAGFSRATSQDPRVAGQPFSHGSAFAPGPSILEPDRFAGTGLTTPGNGEKINIQFSNPDLANSKVTIIVLDGREDERTVVIPLDGKGKGKAEFPVPQDWGAVVLTHPTSSDHSIVVGGS